MESPEIQRELAELRTRVDFIAETLLVLQGLLAIHVTQPGKLEHFEPLELAQLLADKQKVRIRSWSS